MSTSKKLLTIALAAVAITTASLAGTGEAFAHGGKGGKHFRFHRSAIFLSAPVVPSCWKWIGLKKVWVCY